MERAAAVLCCSRYRAERAGPGGLGGAAPTAAPVVRQIGPAVGSRMTTWFRIDQALYDTCIDPYDCRTPVMASAGRAASGS